MAAEKKSKAKNWMILGAVILVVVIVTVVVMKKFGK